MTRTTSGRHRRAVLARNTAEPCDVALSRSCQRSRLRRSRQRSVAADSALGAGLVAVRSVAVQDRARVPRSGVEDPAGHPNGSMSTMSAPAPNAPWATQLTGIRHARLRPKRTPLTLTMRKRTIGYG